MNLDLDLKTIIRRISGRFGIHPELLDHPKNSLHFSPEYAKFISTHAEKLDDVAVSPHSG